MNTRKLSQMQLFSDPTLKVTGIISDGHGGYINVVTDDRYLLTPDEVSTIRSEIAAKASTSVTVNGKPLSADIVLNAADVGALPTTGGTVAGDLTLSGTLTVGGAQVATTDDPAQELPLPDVSIPFNDSLLMELGYGEDLTVGGALVGRKVTFSRASTATYVDKSGVLRTAGVDEPRFEKEGLLVEGMSTNLCTISMPVVGDSGWLKGSGATWSNDGIGPDGSPCLKVSGLNTVTQSLSGSALYMPNQVLDAATTYTFSLWVKVSAYVGNNPHISLRMSGDNNWQKNIDITVEDFNKWVRVSASGLGSPATSFCIGTASPSFILDCEIACVQIEPLPFMTSYIPTSGAAATRARDIATIELPRNYASDNTNPVTIAVSSDCFYKLLPSATMSEFPRILQTQGGGNFYLAHTIYPDGRYQIYYGMGVNATTPTIPQNPNKPIDIVCRIDGGFGVVRAAGVGQSNGTHVPVKTTVAGEITFGSSSRPTWGHIRNFRIWHKALSDYHLKALTK